MTLIVIAIVAAVVIWVITRKVPERPISSVRITTTIIYCADCAVGDAPIKTLLTTANTCHRCGGRSYVLAAIHSPLESNTLKANYRSMEVL